ncbi:GDSL esterase/lipase [Trifolium pratense]|uniref:GDSL esterase/lipase n=1 Tax=Trifolium pratense TaxID=57577 RepID=A0A2K3NND3_TRIPR|nr:GDSL esterase/lipase [Trifolium pratense]
MANNDVVPHEAPSDGRKSFDPLRMITNLHWKDFIDSNWKDTNYKRRAIASLVQAVYLLELDRQENRTQEDSLASNFWIPYKYKPTQILIDERDGSIFGAIFEWDRSAALFEFKPFKPIGAPRAVLALRGTLIRFPTMRRDFEDDFRFVAWESLKDSVRFKVAIDAVKSVSDTYGRRNVCIAGHSLGAGIGLQVGKELAKERINVETHLFNPPAVSLATTLNIGENAEYVWSRIKSMLPSSREAQVSNDVDETYMDETRVIRLKRMMPRLSHLMDAILGTEKWVPHFYVNKNDWISYFYIHTDGTREEIANVENMDPTNEQNEAKLYVFSKEDQKFLEAHGLKQWWSSDGNMELKHDIRNSELVIMQLKSLNTGTPSQVALFYYPQYVSFVTSRINITEATDYVWNILKCVPHHISGKAQISNNGEVSSGISLMGWMPQLSGLKDTGYWVCKWIPRLYVKENVGAEEKMVRKKNMDHEDGQITANLFTVSKEQLKFLAAHGLEQWWPNDSELQQTKLISRHIKSLYTSTPWEVIKGSNGSFLSPATCLGEKEEFIWKWNSLKSMLPSSSESQVRNDDYDSGVGLKGWIPQLSGLKDAAYWVWNRVPHLYVDKNCDTEEKEVDKVSVDPVNEKITAKLCIVSKEQQRFLAARGLKQWWPSDAELQLAIHDSKLISRRIRSLSTNTPWEVTKRMNPFISLPICLDNIGHKEEFVWKWNFVKSILLSTNETQVNSDDEENKTSSIPLKNWMPSLSGFKDAGFAVVKPVPWQLRSLSFVTPAMSLGNSEEKENFVSSSETQASNDSDKTSCVGLKSWIPSLSGLKDAAFEVGKLVPYLYANKSGGQKMVDKERKDPLQ